MSVEVRPFGVKCNIACQYCYQNPERDAGNELRDYDMGKMIAGLQEDGRSFTLFGGEPLLMPLEDLETLWAYGFGKHGRNGVQTNGTLIRDEHLVLFERYRVGVGISVDGPEELNDIRWAGSLERTRAATAATMQAIQRLCEADLHPSLIVTLHRGNAAKERLPRLLAWFTTLKELGVRSVRLHLLEVESELIRLRYALDAEENLAALRALRAHTAELELKLDMFEDMRRMLLGLDKKATCIYTGCDPYTTEAVQGLEGNGQRSNCGRTNKDGIDFVKAEVQGFERYIALYHTPQEHGGCRGCRFFLACKGQCPGTALDGDWRNRTEHCEVLMRIYEDLEEELLDEGHLPLSASPRRVAIEREVLAKWERGQRAAVRPLALKSGRAPEPAAKRA